MEILRVLVHGPCSMHCAFPGGAPCPSRAENSLAILALEPLRERPRRSYERFRCLLRPSLRYGETLRHLRPTCPAEGPLRSRYSCIATRTLTEHPKKFLKC